MGGEMWEHENRDRFLTHEEMAEQFSKIAHESDPTKETLAQLLDDEGFGAWVDTDQLVDTLREHRDMVLAALNEGPHIGSTPGGDDER